MADHSFKGLIDMLRQACAEGIDAVPDAPPELERFIAAMEDTPDWLDMELIEEGARHERVPQALLAPYVVRGAFVATFLNTYAALPMALTGALGGRQGRTARERDRQLLRRDHHARARSSATARASRPPRWCA